MKGPAHDKLWNQLEAEIHLHRHKTVIRACRGRNDSKKPLPSPMGHVGVKLQSSRNSYEALFVLPLLIMLMSSQDPDMLKKTQGVGPIRKVLLLKDDHEGLGISITVRLFVVASAMFASIVQPAWRRVLPPLYCTTLMAICCCCLHTGDNTK